MHVGPNAPLRPVSRARGPLDDAPGPEAHRGLAVGGAGSGLMEADDSRVLDRSVALPIDAPPGALIDDVYLDPACHTAHLCLEGDRDIVDLLDALDAVDELWVVGEARAERVGGPGRDGDLHGLL